MALVDAEGRDEVAAARRPDADPERDQRRDPAEGRQPGPHAGPLAEPVQPDRRREHRQQQHALEPGEGGDCDRRERERLPHRRRRLQRAGDRQGREREQRQGDRLQHQRSRQRQRRHEQGQTRGDESPPSAGEASRQQPDRHGRQAHRSRAGDLRQRVAGRRRAGQPRECRHDRVRDADRQPLAADLQPLAVEQVPRQLCVEQLVDEDRGGCDPQRDDRPDQGAGRDEERERAAGRQAPAAGGGSSCGRAR